VDEEVDELLEEDELVEVVDVLVVLVVEVLEVVDEVDVVVVIGELDQAKLVNANLTGLYAPQVELTT
jgi:hypothetical protein